jgi:hypothetical protein
MLRQHPIAIGREFQEIQESQELFWQAKQPQRVPERSSVDDDVRVSARGNCLLDCEQTRNLGHSRQGCLQQRRNFRSCEQRSVLNGFYQLSLMFVEEAAKQLCETDLPSG